MGWLGPEGIHSLQIKGVSSTPPLPGRGCKIVRPYLSVYDSIIDFTGFHENEVRDPSKALHIMLNVMCTL